MNHSADSPSTAKLQGMLDRLRDGDHSISDELLAASIDRLRHLSRKILADIPGVKRWEDTDDLLQSSSLRLWKALTKHHPSTPLDYYRLASAIIRRQLIDLSRKIFGAEGIGANHVSANPKSDDQFLSPAEWKIDDSNNPEKLGRWTEFHEYVEKLADQERTYFDLMWYQGLTPPEAAQVTGIPERSLRRYWNAARVKLYRDLFEEH